MFVWSQFVRHELPLLLFLAPLIFVLEFVLLVILTVVEMGGDNEGEPQIEGVVGTLVLIWCSLMLPVLIIPLSSCCLWLICAPPIVEEDAVQYPGTTSCFCLLLTMCNSITTAFLGTIIHAACYQPGCSTL